jgi:hypothetical protein
VGATPSAWAIQRKVHTQLAFRLLGLSLLGGYAGQSSTGVLGRHPRHEVTTRGNQGLCASRSAKSAWDAPLSGNRT